MKKRALALLLSLGMLLTASSAAVTVVVAGGAVASATDYRPTYTVVFYLLGGTVDGKTTTALVTDRETGKLPYLPTPERPNYRFDGWFTEPNGGRQITIDDVYTGSIDVYAHWTQVGGLLLPHPRSLWGQCGCYQHAVPVGLRPRSAHPLP